jgi:hypothetical protein
VSGTSIWHHIIGLETDVTIHALLAWADCSTICLLAILLTTSACALDTFKPKGRASSNLLQLYTNENSTVFFSRAWHLGASATPGKKLYGSISEWAVAFYTGGGIPSTV